MAKGFGLWPDFATMDADNAYELLTTGSEIMRMIRDGDSNSDDERARTVYGKLLTGD